MTKFLINGIWYELVLEDNGIAVLQDMYDRQTYNF
jgi:hypothetical protein